jgi:hypothetical protein
MKAGGGLDAAAVSYQKRLQQSAGSIQKVTHSGKAIVPIEDVCRDYLSHLRPTRLVRKISAGEIAVPWCEWKQLRNAQKASIFWI